MDFDFVLDKKHLAFRILTSDLENENLENQKKDLYFNHEMAYKKLVGVELLDNQINFNDEKTKYLIAKLSAAPKFQMLLKNNPNEVPEKLAVKTLLKMAHFEDEEIKNIRNLLWEEDKDAYENLINSNNPDFKTYLEDRDISNLLNDFIKTNAFATLHKESLEYLNIVKDSWNLEKDRINNFLKNIIRVDYSIKPTVYIMHPSTKLGKVLSENEIMWGHSLGLDDPNYNLTYLVHEGLHCLLPYDKKETKEENDMKHAVIEMISDYELYSYLSSESKIDQGHHQLREERSFIYPYWLDYIALNEEEKQARMKKDNVNINLEDHNENLSSLNILEFINYCNYNYQNTNKEVKSR